MSTTTLETPDIEIITKPTTPTLRYPVLMQAVENKHIVLFTNETEGTVLHGGQSHMSVGFHFESWTLATDAVIWTPFTGTLPLRNTTLP